MSPSTANDPVLELSVTRTRSPPTVSPKERWIDNDGRLVAWSSWNGAEARLEIPGTGVFCGSRHSTKARAFVSPDLAETRLESDFRRIARPLLLQAKGWQVLHASAVSTGRGVVGLCGRSGAGKSTLARAWTGPKSRPFADDALLFTIRGRTPETIRLSHLSLGRNAGSEPARPLSALVILVVDNQLRSSPALEKLEPAAALSLTLPHALCFDSTDPQAKSELFSAYCDLVTQLPTFRLRYHQTPGAAGALVELLRSQAFGGASRSAQTLDR